MGRTVPPDTKRGSARGPRPKSSTDPSARKIETEAYDAAHLAALEERNTELKRRLAEQRREADALRAQLASKRRRPPDA